MNVCNYCGIIDNFVLNVGAVNSIDVFAHKTCLLGRACDADMLEVALAASASETETKVIYSELEYYEEYKEKAEAELAKVRKELKHTNKELAQFSKSLDNSVKINKELEASLSCDKVWVERGERIAEILALKDKLKAEKAKMALAIEKIETMLEYQERMNHIDNEDVCDALARCLEVMREAGKCLMIVQEEEAKMQEAENDNDRLRKENQTVVSQNVRLGHIASQLGMCRRDTDSGKAIYDAMWKELAEIKYPELKEAQTMKPFTKEEIARADKKATELLESVTFEDEDYCEIHDLDEGEERMYCTKCSYSELKGPKTNSGEGL